MQLQLYRNATMKLAYAGHTLLLDPMLAEVGAIRSFAGLAPNPTVPLPVPIATIVQDVEALLVSHCHPDHFDPAAIAALDQDLPVLAPPSDLAFLREAGFTDLRPIATTGIWNNIRLTRTGGAHGRDAIVERMGPVSGYVLQADGEPTVYWIGDSVLCPPVREAIACYQPQIIVSHSGGATLPGFAPILMDAAETIEIARLAPQATIVAVHLEALDHCTVSRAALRAAADAAGIAPNRLFIPQNGETLVL